MDVNLIIAPAGEGITIGFQNDHFMQGVIIPVTTIEDAQALGMGIFNQIVTAAEQVLAARNTKV